MLKLHYIYVSCVTVFKLVATVFMGYLAAPMLSALHSTDRGLSFITLRVLLSSMLFGNLCLDISVDLLRSYYWAVIMSLIPQILGALFSFMLRKTVSKEWRVLLVLGSTFQNGLTFPLSVVTSIKGIRWLDEEVRKDCEQYVFLYNLTCAVGLWSIGNPLVKYFKDKYAAEAEDAALEAYYSVSYDIHKLSAESINIKINNIEESDYNQPTEESNTRDKKGECLNCDDNSNTDHTNELTNNKNELASANKSNTFLSNELLFPISSSKRLMAKETLDFYRPLKHKDRPISIAKYDEWQHKIATIKERIVNTNNNNNNNNNDKRVLKSNNVMSWRRRRLPLWDYFFSIITTYFYSRTDMQSRTTMPLQNCNCYCYQEEEEQRFKKEQKVSISLHTWDRSWRFILGRVFWIVWGALNTLPVMLTILAITISLISPLRTLAETQVGLTVIGGIARLGQGCVPIQLITLGVTLAKQYEPLEKEKFHNTPLSAAWQNNVDNVSRGRKESETQVSGCEVSARWYHVIYHLKRISNLTCFMVVTIALRLLLIPALSFVIVHFLIKWNVMPTSKPFVVSILVGISSPAAVNCSLVCIMQQYHPNEFARMIFYMYCFAVITSTFWIAVSITYASNMP